MMRHTVCFAFALAALADGTHAATSQDAAPKPLSDDLRSAILAGRAIPNGAGLTLVLTGGRHLTLTNNARGCPRDAQGLDDGNCYRYVLLRDLPSQHAFVVDEIYYEGDSLLLIDDRTGRQTGLDGMPVFSPDGARFFVAVEDEDRKSDNNLQLWRRDRDGAVIEWVHPYKKVQVEVPALKEPYHVKVSDWSPSDAITLAFTGEGRSWNGHLTRGAKGWTLNADWPKP